MKKILLSLMVSLLLALPVTADDAAPYTYQDLSESLSLNIAKLALPDSAEIIAKEVLKLADKEGKK